jgi:hypothetical protein
MNKQEPSFVVVTPTSHSLRRALLSAQAVNNVSGNDTLVPDQN